MPVLHEFMCTFKEPIYLACTMYSLVPRLSANTQNDASNCVFVESLDTRRYIVCYDTKWSVGHMLNVCIRNMLVACEGQSRWELHVHLFWWHVVGWLIVCKPICILYLYLFSDDLFSRSVISQLVAEVLKLKQQAILHEVSTKEP